MSLNAGTLTFLYSISLSQCKHAREGHCGLKMWKRRRTINNNKKDSCLRIHNKVCLSWALVHSTALELFFSLLPLVVLGGKRK